MQNKKRIEKMKIGQAHIRNIVDTGLCTGCGICTAVCHTNALKIENNVCSMGGG